MLKKENIQNIYPLTPMQEGMFFHALYEPNSSVFFEQTANRIHGALDIRLVRESLTLLIRRYDILRTVFSQKHSEKLLQIVLKERPLDFLYEDISLRRDKETYIADFRKKDREKVFDLTKDVLIRVAVFKLSDAEYEFIWSHPHILMDGWCVGILISEFVEIYGSLCDGKPVKLPPVIPFSRYIRWLDDQDPLRSRDYWSDYLADFNEMTSVPRLPGLEIGEEGNGTRRLKFMLDTETTHRIQEIAASRQFTLNTLAQCLWGILLARYSGKDDVVFGTVVSGRPTEIEGIESMVGLFVNTVPLRIRTVPGTLFSQLMLEVQQHIVKSEPYQYYPLVKIQAHSRLGHNLFDHITVFQNVPLGERFDEISSSDGNGRFFVSEMETSSQSNYDLNVLMWVGIKKSLVIRIDFNTAFYDPQYIESIGRKMMSLLQQVAESVDPAVEEFSFLSEEEKRRLLIDFNNTAKEYPADLTLYRLFEEQVERTGDAVALISMEHGETIPARVTYGELYRKADLFAGELIEKGVTPGDIVALLLKPSVERAAAILGILKIGGAYLPIDPEYPEERIKYILADSGANTLLTHRDLTGVFNLNTDVGVRHAVPLQSSGLAYIIYTSGTTGRPKGVAVRHRNAVNTLLCRKETYRLSTADVVLQLFSYAFDGFITGFFTPLISGAALISVSDEMKKDPALLAEIITSYRVSHFICVPPLYRAILECLAPGETTALKTVTLAGDRLSDELLELSRQQVPGVEIVNEYGVTEAAVMSTMNRHQEQQRRVTIGKPAWNTAIYILDEQDRLQPVGVPGELCIAGAGLSMGYLNNPELTAERFIILFPKEKLYKTGDLARRLPDGTIEWLGRMDFQVKIRGFRIELGEIENKLLEHDAVKEAVVVERTDMNGDKYLCGYFVSDESLEPAQLREFLGNKLPGYMVPRLCVQMNRLPLTPNDKIDRKALPQPEGSAPGKYTAPRSETEQKLAAIWAEILGLEPRHFGIDSDFFQLGGHSLNVISLSSRIHKEFNIKVTPAEIFKNSTIRQSASLITGSREDQFVAVTPAELREYYPTSSAQKRLYLLYRMETGSTAYNMHHVSPIPGNVDKERFERTLRQLVERHESLRTSFFMHGDLPVQRIHSDIVFDVEYYEVGEGGLRPWLEGFIRPFDLSRVPLFRVGVACREDADDIMVVDMHHIISDGISQAVLSGDFSALYQGEVLPPLPLQYKDYSQWRNSPKERENIQRQEAYWKESFADGIPVLELPADYPRPESRTFEGSTETFEIENGIVAALRQVAREQGVTLYMLVLAAVNILCARLSGAEAVVIGTPAAGRRHADLERIIGVFINTLALKNYPVGDKTFKAFLQELKSRTLEAFENQDYPFEDLVEVLAVNRDISRNPIFDVMFSLDKVTSGSSSVRQVEDYEIEIRTAKVDLSIMGIETGEKLLFTLEYWTRLFKRETIHHFFGYFKKILSAVSEGQGQSIAYLDILPEEEKRQLLVDINRTAVDYPAHKTVVHLFEEQVEKAGDSVALTYRDRVITFDELNRRSGLLPVELTARGAQPGSIIALITEPSIDMITAILGILKTGAAYLPIDPNAPEERKHRILADSGAAFLVTGEREPGAVHEGLETIDLMSVFSRPASDSLNYINRAEPSGFAYIIYTSGSTGQPKGVMVFHRNLTAYISAFLNEFALGSSDIVLQQASYTFDAFAEEMYPVLVSGGTLAIPAQGTVKDMDLLSAFIDRHCITVVDTSPLLLNELNKRPVSRSVRIYISGGDVLLRSHVAGLTGSGAAVFNTYGPTETTVCATYYRYTPGDSSFVPIGKPIANYRVYILDKYLQPVPMGAAGELCIAGDGVTAGYLNHPELTAERFVVLDRTYESHGAYKTYLPKEKLYRTGDRVRLLADGNIRFLGRLDNQVNVRGFRIEPGEVEYHLLRHPAVQDAVVMGKEKSDEETYLCVYYTVHGDETVDATALRTYLSHRLPIHMVPTVYIRLEQMPLTNVGKIDRSVLLKREDAGEEPAAGEQLPRSAGEALLAAIWQEVLGRSHVGIHEDFFTIGGDSIKAIRISSRLNSAGYAMEMGDLFRFSSIAQLAPLLKKSVASAPQTTMTGRMPLTPIQYEFFRNVLTDPHHFNQSVMFHLEEHIDESDVLALFYEIFRHHDALRTVFPKGNDGAVYAWVEDEERQPLVHVFDLRLEKDAPRLLVEKGNLLQSGFNLETGPLVQVGLFRMPDGDRLLVIIHHLVVDGVSWRILLEDIETLYKQLKENPETRTLQLSEKSHSFKTWSEYLSRYAADESFLNDEKKYWAELEKRNIPPIPRDFTAAVANDGKHCATISFTLDAGETGQLLTGCHEAFATEMNDILLTALALAVEDTFGLHQVLTALEGHGREELFSDLNISRTVGWFTTVYPVILTVSPGDITRTIKEIKETLHQVPRKGIGYGILKYLTPKEQRNDITFHLDPRISFNYLGQFDEDTRNLSFRIARESTGENLSPDAEREFDLDITGMITGGQLHMSVRYHTGHFKSATVERMMGAYKEQLLHIIGICSGREVRERTPSDFTYNKMSIDSVAALSDMIAENIEI